MYYYYFFFNKASVNQFALFKIKYLTMLDVLFDY